MSGSSVAVLGATSRLALDFVVQAMVAGRYELHLYARRPEAAAAALAKLGQKRFLRIDPLEGFGTERHCAVLNCIGVGDPARALAMGAEIFESTRYWDRQALDYLGRFPETTYVFLSSGAVYGDAFDAPVTPASVARYPVNGLGPRNWYSLAKLGAEAIHRSEADKSIIDVRIFNYFSSSIDLQTRFLITDMLRCVQMGEVFETSSEEIVRDYLEPEGLHALLAACLSAPMGTNRPVDAYSRAPIGKIELVELMARELGLEFRLTSGLQGINATGIKPHYYSLNRSASDLGYDPLFTSAEAILKEARILLGC